ERAEGDDAPGDAEPDPRRELREGNRDEEDHDAAKRDEASRRDGVGAAFERGLAIFAVAERGLVRRLRRGLALGRRALRRHGPSVYHARTRAWAAVARPAADRVKRSRDATTRRRARGGRPQAAVRRLGRGRPRRMT